MTLHPIRWLLKKILPAAIKRLVFLSSLAAYVRDVKNPDQEMLEKLNEVLMLSSDPQALKLPMQINSVIWGKFNMDDIKVIGDQKHSSDSLSMSGLQRSQTRIMANRLIDYMPEWLRYQSKEKMRQDIYRLFLCMDQMKSKNNPEIVAH